MLWEICSQKLNSTRPMLPFHTSKMPNDREVNNDLQNINAFIFIWLI